MKRLYYIILLLCSICIISCKKEQVLTFTDIDRIQFGPIPSSYYSTSARFTDTLKNFSFAYFGIEHKIDTVFFDIYTMGTPKDFDRSFLLKQEMIPGANNAIAGVHYKDFNDGDVKSKYIIKAGQAHAKVPVVLLRDASLESSRVELKFNLVENTDFKLGEKVLSWRKVAFTDQLIKPDAWSSALQTQFYGSYSEAKHRFMIGVTGQKWDQDFLNEIRVYTETVQYWMSVVKTALAAHNAENPNNPIVDEITNLPIVFP